jgi:hypothetical protein
LLSRVAITEPAPSCRPQGARLNFFSPAQKVRSKAILNRFGETASQSLISIRRTEESSASVRSSKIKRRTNRRIACVLAVLCSGIMTLSARAQQTQEPEDPEDDKQIGLWIDQAVSIDLPANRSVELEFHERFDEGATNFYEYFIQGGLAFRPRPWFTLIPSYRYQRFPGNPAIAYENRVLLNLTASMSRGLWRPTFRTLFEGRFPDSRLPFLSMPCSPTPPESPAPSPLAGRLL